MKNIIAKQNLTETYHHHGRDFDFRKYKKRHIALKFLYLGWDYHGYVVQEDTTKTIEHYLFDALVRTKLIVNRESSNYHRCGRTDKGVSAFSQVISIDVRSNLTDGRGIFIPADYIGNDRGHTEEINYCSILNKVLPPEIKCISWAPVDIDFSARFDCTKRTYKYFFPRGTLNLDKMLEAAKLLIGSHDFRNLCKMDVKNGVTNFIRRLESVELSLIPSNSSNTEAGYEIVELTINGNAFLWHQIRCIVAVLVLIGEGKESPGLISELLDIEANPRKPQYHMASELPLCLFDSQYDVEKLMKWELDDECLVSLTTHLQSLWACSAIKTAMIKSMLFNLPRQEICSDVQNQHNLLSIDDKAKVHKPLFDRQLCGKYLIVVLTTSTNSVLFCRKS